MVDKVHGNFVAGEHLTGNNEFFTLTTAVDIRIASEGDEDSQKALDKLVEVISLRGQPVIAGKPTVDGSDYVFKFSNEHYGSWTGATPTLVESIVAHAGHLGFTALNTSVTISDLI